MIYNLIGSGLTLGVGSELVSKVGGPTAPFAAASKFLTPIAVIGGAGYTLKYADKTFRPLMKKKSGYGLW